MRCRTLAVATLAANPAADETRIKELEALVDDLGMPANVLVGGLFHLGLAGFRVLADGSLDNQYETILGLCERSGSAFEDADKLFSMFVEDPRMFLSDVSCGLSHGGLWVFAVLARLNNAYKKASKVKPFPMDSARFVQVRDVVAKAFARMATALEAIRKRVTGIAVVDSSLIVNEECFKDTMSQVSQAVEDSYAESLKRLAGVASAFSTVELYLT